MTDSVVLRQILLDEPSQKDLFHGQGHDRTADALASAIKNFKHADRAIGLDGPWGSGKSSVVGIAESKLAKSSGKGKVSFHFFTFDIWKSQGSAFRRSFLEHFVSWAKETFPSKQKELTAIESRIRGKIREVDTDNQLHLGWYGIAILLAVPFIPIYVLWSKWTFEELTKAGNALGFLSSFPMWAIYAFIVMTVIVAMRKCQNGAASGRLADHGFGSRFRLALSSTLLIGAKQYEHQKVTQYIRETDPNDFEFQSILREVLSTIQSQQVKVVMVLDNIDRLPADEINTYWALVRSIFSRHHSGNPSTRHNHITAIVPYDRRLIEASSSVEFKEGELPSLKAKEIFSKTFDEILVVGPPVMSNTKEFFTTKIAEALPELTDEDVVFRAYLLFNWMIDREGGRATPRQVIAFINELSSIYVLHRGKIGLPTVAVYLAIQDTLERRPIILAQQDIVESTPRALAADKDLERNLAAILFNVEPDLAYQILLDGEIKSAIGAGTSERLITLSKSSGFEVRIGEVFSNNVSEWISADRFGDSVGNLSDLLKQYDGEAARYLNRSLVDAFQKVPSIAIGRDTALYLKLLDACASGDRSRVIEHLIEATSAGLPKPEDLAQSDGRKFHKFLADLSAAAVRNDAEASFRVALKKAHLLVQPDFLFGFASVSQSSVIRLLDLQKPVIVLTPDDIFLETVAVDQANESLAAFSEFQSAGLVTDDNWVRVANKLVTSLAEENLEDEEEVVSRLSLLSATTVYAAKKRGNVELSSLFESVRFYENLHLALSDDIDNSGLGHAIFLAYLIYYKGSLPIPTHTVAGRGSVQGAAAEFAWFKEILDGERELTSEQHNVVAKQLSQSNLLYTWLEFGSQNADNKLVQYVINAAYSGDRRPWIPENQIFSYYPFLKRTLGPEFDRALPKIASRFASDKIRKLGVEAYPADILIDTAAWADAEWKVPHEHAAELLDNIAKDDWLKHLTENDDYINLLWQKVMSSGYLADTSALKDAFLEFVLGVLAGSIQPTSEERDYDAVFKAIDKGYHLEFFKMIRERIQSVSATSTQLSARLFPELLSNVIIQGEKSRQEKEHLVRYMMRPALESGTIVILDAFLALGRKTVADFIRSSEVSTQETLEPALRIFSKNRDYDYLRRVTDLIQGRKARTFLDLLFPTKNDDDQ